MGDRKTLHQKLVSVLGNNRVYFQPPESIKMSYPCIVYSLDKIEAQHANNAKYICNKRYSVTFITRDPDDKTVEDILAL